MKEDRELIGYRLKDESMSKAVDALTNQVQFKNVKNGFGYYDLSYNSMSIADFRKAGVLNIWFEPVYKDQEKVLYFGKVKFTIKPGSNVASTTYGDIKRSAIKNAIDYISNPPSLIGHEFNIHIGSSEPKSLIDIGSDHVASHKIGFGCQSGTLYQLIAIYKAFD